MDKNTILIGIAVIAIIITGVLIFANLNHGFSFLNILGSSDNQIGNKVVSYINDNQLSSTPATLVSVSEQSGLVKVKIKIGTSSFDSYATKDGNLLFPQAFDMGAKKATAAADKNAGSTTPSASQTPDKATPVVKTDKPMLEAYIVSGCPFGLQMQRAMAEAEKNSSALAPYIKVRYMGSVEGGKITSMHGQEEADENLRQICIRDEQPTKYWSYVACYMKKSAGAASSGMPYGDSTGCQATTGVDKAKLSACVADPARGLANAQKDFNLSTKYGVSGSPTLILNGATISENGYGGRSADGVRSMACAGFNTQPSFCSTKLTTAAAATSFSATYASAAGGAAANTNCAPAAQ